MCNVPHLTPPAKAAAAVVCLVQEHECASIAHMHEVLTLGCGTSALHRIGHALPPDKHLTLFFVCVQDDIPRPSNAAKPKWLDDPLLSQVVQRTVIVAEVSDPCAGTITRIIVAEVSAPCTGTWPSLLHSRLCAQHS